MMSMKELGCVSVAVGCQAICQHPINSTIREDSSDCVTCFRCEILSYHITYYWVMCLVFGFLSGVYRFAD